MIEPDLQGSPDHGRCQERCGPYLRPGEVASCESVQVRGTFEERYGYRDGTLCVMGPPRAR